MVITYKEALDRYGSRYRVRKAVAAGELRSVSRGMYSTDADADNLAIMAKKYPNGIATGQTALYAYGLIDLPPEKIDLATRRGGSKIESDAVRQHFVPEEWIGVGRTTIDIDGVPLPAYDQERMLLELMRSRNKIPYDMYREAVASYRKRADRLDIYKLQDYAALIPRGESYLNRAMEEVF